MATPKQTEPSANNALGAILRSMMPKCMVLSENTQTFTDFPGRHADVLVTASGRSPVTVEAEFEPAPEAEKDARERLGLKVNGDDRTIEASIAVRYPSVVEAAYDLDSALREATLSYCVLYDDGARFPESGWLQGTVEDLADLVRLVSVPQKEVEKAANTLERGIEEAATLLDQMAQSRPALSATIARLLGMADVPQTRRMACAILANALIFHERIAGLHDDIKPLLLLGDSTQLQDATLEAWGKILDIDYYSIFSIARDILMQLPAFEAAQVLEKLRATARAVNATGVDNAHDLTGRIFQRLISDRKYLATFYTRPASAALLARLAVAKMEGVDWGDAEALGKLRVGDFACGTGALLSAVYEQIAARHERAGGDVAELHPVMMEEVLYGCDVMPSAIHITGSTLSGLQPNVDFGQSRLYTMPYGRQADDTVKIGSLELLQDSQVQTLFNTSDPAQRTGSLGEETATQVNVDIQDEGFDLVIMNPPFTRNTTREGATKDKVAGAFAAFEADYVDQRDMANRLGQMKVGSCYHGNVGLGSGFAGLAHKKLRPGGVLALVLPLSAIVGVDWSKFRQMLVDDYHDIAIATIKAGGGDIAFSFDTGEADCLIVAKRKNSKLSNCQNVHFISLNEPPKSFGHAKEIATKCADSNVVRSVEDGPFGGTRVTVGDQLVGDQLLFPVLEQWAGARVSDYSLSQTAYALINSLLWIPGFGQALELNVTQLGNLGERGKYHLDIDGTPPRGPFDRVPIAAETVTYPALWNHHAKGGKENKIQCEPDTQLEVRPGMEQKAAVVWETAGRAHITQDFRFTSQPLCAAFTHRRSIGGTAWPNVNLLLEEYDYPFVLWANCTLGLLAFWWIASFQHDGRGRISITSVPLLPVLDFRTLSDEQLAKAKEIFEEFHDKELMPAYLVDADPNRALLDRRVICDLLGFDESIYQGVRRLAEKWCAEPSVHGGKPRPKNANFAM